MKCASVLLITLLTTACGDTIVNPTSISTSDQTSPPTSQPTQSTTSIEFRVNGNAQFAVIRYSDPIDGLTFVTSTLPYDVSIKTTASSLFLELDVTPTKYLPSVLFPFMSAQIFADGVLFREANSSDWSLNTLTVSGTWRK
jgi:hypothetical protein